MQGKLHQNATETECAENAFGGGMSRRYRCPCCGYFTLEEEAGSFEICPVCYWENDPYMNTHETEGGGANVLSLLESRENYERIGAVEERFLGKVRTPMPWEVEDEITEDE